MRLKPIALALFLFPFLSFSSLSQISSGSQEQAAQHQRLAQQYLQQQRPDLAIPELQKVIELDPGNVDALGNLGVLYFFRGNYKEAVPQLRAALQIQPGLFKLQALLGLAERSLGDRTTSRKDLEAAFPQLTETKIQAQVGQALMSDYTVNGDLEKAAAIASTLLQAQPMDSSLLYSSYRIYSDLAGKAMLTLALTAPASAQMHQVMARELARHAENAAAIANYREAIKIDPHLLGIHSEFGDLLYRSPDAKLKAEAEQEFRAALAANPNDELALVMLGMIASSQGNNSAAIADYTQALAIDPDNGDACTELGKVLVTMNQDDKALQLFEHAIQIDPTNYTAHYRLGTLYREADRSDDAKKQIAQYLEYKRMRDKLEKIFSGMRVLSGQHRDDDEDGVR
jgi:cytochrome c-type biogenesis protein CcmH/NrfG